VFRRSFIYLDFDQIDKPEIALWLADVFRELFDLESFMCLQTIHTPTLIL
jgi:hypothetical protein